MNLSNSAALSSNDRVLAASLAVLSTFILGYSATRVLLNLATANPSQGQEAVVPHQAAGWSALGEHSVQ
ncbi:MAG: hypothetical protein AAGB01_00255 [Cyanobacteria bacterium P01_F01_bin.42]